MLQVRIQSNITVLFLSIALKVSLGFLITTSHNLTTDSRASAPPSRSSQLRTLRETRDRVHDKQTGDYVVTSLFQATMAHTVKGPAPQLHDGSNLRIGIVHARWNATIIEPLVKGTKDKLLECGVKESNIVIQSVPGSWELPIAVKQLYAASQVQATSSAAGGASAGDLLGSSTTDLTAMSTSTSSASAPFDALIAIGVLIKGETMHFEYIADAVSHGLMRTQLDIGIPVIFGVLTVLNDEQAKARAGILQGSHNHGEDWGLAAVELSVKRTAWAKGQIE
jgi:6,7-dimethyl-8-ribityllumazine synthase